MSSTAPTQVLSRFLANLSYEQLPREVVEQVKRLTLHCIAAAIAARPLEQAEKTIRMTEQKGGIPQATIWGSDGSKVPVSEAVFANGTLADILDWEDCSWTGHPSAAAVPVAIALAEAQPVSGRDYITAVVAAYEGYQRIAMSAQPSAERLASGRSWGIISWQIHAAALAAAKLQGFSADRINQLFGACLYSTIVPSARHSKGLAKSDIYHYAHGFAARNGVVAAEITAAGFDNCRDTLDGPDGYWSTISDRVDWSWYGHGLDERWLINETYLKHWPANMWVQTPLEILDALHREQPIVMADVVDIRVSPHLPFISGRYADSTRSALDAQFSIPYCLTAYLMNPEPGVHWFSDSMRNDPGLLTFTERFSFHGEKRTPQDNFRIFQAGSFPEFTLDIALRDGRTRSRSMRFPKGHPQNPLSLDEIVEHFRRRCGPHLSAERIDAIVDCVLDIENRPDLSNLGALCAIGRV